MESSLNIARGLIPWGWEAHYALKGTVAPFHISILADRCLNTLLPAMTLKGEALTDLKGGDLPATDQVRKHELLYLKGRFLLEPETDTDIFSLGIYTSFLEFLGVHHIKHSVSIDRAGIPDFIPTNLIARIFPAEIEVLRIGLELFESQRISSLFGFAPSVKQRLLLSCQRDELVLEISAMGLKMKNTLPLQKDALMQRLSDTLIATCGFDLKADYIAKAN